MKKRFAILLPAVLAAALLGCSKEETSAPGTGATGSTATVAKIPILPGFKYYIGGPSLKRDPYGHFRIAKFNGEVEQPPSRGMIFGVKLDGNQLEYRVWGNGKLLAVHRGVMRDGLFWQEYAESYRDEKLVAREHNVNDDSIKRYKQTTEDIDPETGEVIRTKEASISYYPPARMPDDDDEAAPTGGGGQDSVTSEMLEGELQAEKPAKGAAAAATKPAPAASQPAPAGQPATPAGEATKPAGQPAKPAGQE
ncbi:MAG TPA: hypothetical protein VN634_07530 [Candidatus Limnocylindrales bacterium]|nr:hypothetical protein [Candidatus Limnocylindrales bacterium]